MLVSALLALAWQRCQATRPKEGEAKVPAEWMGKFRWFNHKWMIPNSWLVSKGESICKMDDVRLMGVSHHKPPIKGQAHKVPTLKTKCRAALLFQERNGVAKMRSQPTLCGISGSIGPVWPHMCSNMVLLLEPDRACEPDRAYMYENIRCTACNSHEGESTG